MQKLFLVLSRVGSFAKQDWEASDADDHDSDVANDDECVTAAAPRVDEPDTSPAVSSVDPGGSRMSLAAARDVLNNEFAPHTADLAALSDVDFASLVLAINSYMMALTQSIFSCQDKLKFRFLCVRRKGAASIDLEPIQRVARTPKNPHNIRCTAGFRVTKPTERDFLLNVSPFELIVLIKTDGGLEHFVGQDGCESCDAFPLNQVYANENYSKGVVTKVLLERILRLMHRQRNNDRSLSRKNVRLQIDGIFEECGLSPCPEHLYRALEAQLKLRQYGTSDIERITELNSAWKLIELFDRHNIPHEYYETAAGVIEAIYYADAALIQNREDFDNANMAVHDTSFGIQDPYCGFDFLSILSTIEAAGGTQIAIVGVSVSNKSEYFDVMLRLLKRVYPKFAGQPGLLMFSDEDRAFIKSTHTVLPNASTFICIWHKMKNVRKKRSLRGTKKKKHSDKDDTEEADEVGDEEEKPGMVAGWLEDLDLD